MLASKCFEEIATLKETIVKVPIQLEVEGKKIKHERGKIANILKEEHFLPSLWPKLTWLQRSLRHVTCGLWPVAYLCYLYFSRVNKEVQCYVYPGQDTHSGFLKLTPN